MSKMIKMATVMVGVACSLVFAGCSKGPDKVALEVLNKVSSGEASGEFLKEYCTEPTAALFGMAGPSMAKEMKGVKFTVVDSKIDGDKAVVTIKNSKDNKTEKFDLVKVDGKWKMDVNKESLR